MKRVGLTLKKTQKEQLAAAVKSGDYLAAQRLILGEIKTCAQRSAT